MPVARWVASLVNSRQHIGMKLIYIFLVLCLCPSAFSQNTDSASYDKVIVEPSYVVKDSDNNKQYSRYYPDRRKKWGGTVSLGVGKPEFNEYTTAVSAGADFATTYDSGKDLLYDLNINFKRNFSALSLGLNIGVSFAKVGSKEDTPDLDITLNPLRLGLVAALDNVFKKNPYIVPYIGAGIQTIKYEEENKTTELSEKETSGMSQYINGGLMFQIDWIDRETGLESFYEAGLQNTFIYLDFINYMSAEEKNKPNLEAAILSAGIRVEY